MYSQLNIKDLLSLTVNEATATDLLSKFSSIKEIASAAPEELALVKGIGKVKAQQLLSALELGKRIYTRSNLTDRLSF